MATKVYLCSMELPGRTVPDIALLSEGLSEERREKINSRRFEKDKIQALGAGLLLDHGLREYGLRERSVHMAYGGNGKPYLADHPEIHFNLSHSGTMAMAVFSDRETGCDVERVQEARMGVAQRFFAEAELEELKRQPPGEKKDELFFRIWTLKESYLKVTGEGMRIPLNSFSVCLGQSPAGYEFREFSVPGYQAAVCLKESKSGSPSDIFFSFQNLTDVVRYP